MEKLTRSEDLLKLSKEYQERKTLEARTAKDADLLDQMMILKEYYWQGSKEAEDWLKIEGKTKGEQEKLMFTKAARNLAKEIKRQNPSDWWASLWTSKRR
jgi:5'-deoxynucleotidase YfbR-like HD superfamily hydrolase